MSLASHSFFDEWSIYDEILARNSMHHDDLYVHVGRFLAERFGAQPFSILDLGCGSARHLAQALAGRVVRQYIGYDLSQVALGHARQNLAGLEGRVSLRCADLMDGVRASRARVDLIFTSFALHHLHSEGKAEFFKLAAERLAAEGVLLVIDTFRDDGESRDDYMERYCAWLHSRCRTLPESALDLLCEHVRSCDYPASMAEYRAMTAAAGFMGKAEIARYQWHRLLCYELLRLR